MHKYIALRFKDYCRGCGEPMNAGAPAVWMGRADGVKHINCFLFNKKVLETALDW